MWYIFSDMSLLFYVWMRLEVFLNQCCWNMVWSGVHKSIVWSLCYAHVLNLCHFPQRPVSFKVPIVLLHTLHKVHRKNILYQYCKHYQDSLQALGASTLVKFCWVWRSLEDLRIFYGGRLHFSVAIFTTLARDRKWHLPTAGSLQSTFSPTAQHFTHWTQLMLFWYSWKSSVCNLYETNTGALFKGMRAKKVNGPWWV